MKSLTELDSKNNSPRLIPIAKQPERRLLSVFMSLIEFSEALRHEFLLQCGCRIARTGSYESYMEVTYSGSRYLDVRPDGLITCKRGKTEWSALVEAKAENAKIRIEQVQDYLQLAEQLGIDAVITISNDFALRPSEPPYAIAKSKLKGRKLFHFAWAEIRMFLELHRESTALTAHERHILRQCLDYFWSDGSGVRTYDSMPEGWPAFVEASCRSAGGRRGSTKTRPQKPIRRLCTGSQVFLGKRENHDRLTRACGQSGFPFGLISDSSFQNGGLNERAAVCGFGHIVAAA